MSEQDGKYDQGMNLGIQLGGTSFEKTVKELEAIDQEVGQYLVEDAYGTILSRGGLPLVDRELCIIAALAASGYATQLSWHVNAARNLGIPIFPTTSPKGHMDTSTGVPASR